MATADVLAYLAGLMLVVWGVAHVAATRAVLSLYGELSTDNRRVWVMEWVAEGFTHVFVGLLVVVITAIEGAGESGATVVHRSCAAFELVLVGWTAATGARTPYIWYRICLVVLSVVAGLLLAASIV
ncbi:MAG TPA: hypothetical protein VLB81_08740 [Gaiellales bacterium]|nr:hypothetical protein [Gaiellales bacterium]